MNIDRNEWNFWWKSKKKKPKYDKDQAKEKHEEQEAILTAF